MPWSLGSWVSEKERIADSSWSAVRPWRAAASLRARFGSSTAGALARGALASGG